MTLSDIEPSRSNGVSDSFCEVVKTSFLSASSKQENCATVVQVLQDLFYVLLHVLFYL